MSKKKLEEQWKAEVQKAETALRRAEELKAKLDAPSKTDWKAEIHWVVTDHANFPDVEFTAEKFQKELERRGFTLAREVKNGRLKKALQDYCSFHPDLLETKLGPVLRFVRRAKYLPPHPGSPDLKEIAAAGPPDISPLVGAGSAVSANNANKKAATSDPVQAHTYWYPLAYKIATMGKAFQAKELRSWLLGEASKEMGLDRSKLKSITLTAVEGWIHNAEQEGIIRVWDVTKQGKKKIYGVATPGLATASQHPPASFVPTPIPTPIFRIPKEDLGEFPISADVVKPAYVADNATAVEWVINTFVKGMGWGLIEEQIQTLASSVMGRGRIPIKVVEEINLRIFNRGGLAGFKTRGGFNKKFGYYRSDLAMHPDFEVWEPIQAKPLSVVQGGM